MHKIKCTFIPLKKWNDFINHAEPLFEEIIRDGNNIIDFCTQIIDKISTKSSVVDNSELIAKSELDVLCVTLKMVGDVTLPFLKVIDVSNQIIWNLWEAIKQPLATSKKNSKDSKRSTVFA